jgi:glycerophosphoryl diester phosphodiesterase
MKQLACLLALAWAPAAFAGAKVEIIGHRGASYDAPENTVAAFKLSWAQKADASELDIFLSKDGKIVCIHDKDTKRVAGVDKKVADQTLAELRMLDAGKWQGARFAGEKIPTLEEMLATTPEGKRVFVEVKTGPEILPELDRVLRASRLKAEQTPIISFNAKVIAEVKRVRPDLAAYWIVNMKPKDKEPPTLDALIAKAKSINADGLDLSVAPVLDKPFADKIRAAGLKLYVWTVNDVAVARRMVALGVDGITTDRPGWLRDQLAK